MSKKKLLSVFIFVSLKKTDKKGQQGHATTISPMLLLLRLSLTYSQTMISVTRNSVTW